MAQQKGILEPPQKHILIMTFALDDPGSAAAALEILWSDIAERLHDYHSGDGLTITIGFGRPIFAKLGKADAMPAGLRFMPGWEGDRFQPFDTQADLIVQVCADDRGVLSSAERDVRRYLAPAFTVRDYEIGFGIQGSRGNLGFIDGTGNPHGDASAPVALIGDEDADRRDGTFMVFRKIVEDLQAWGKLSVDDQEKAVGRRLGDGAPFDPSESTPPTSHRSKSSATKNGHEIQMVRRSFPFGGRDEAGLLFVCFVRDLDQFEVIKTQMASAKNLDGTSPGLDAIHAQSTPVSGGYYYVPPEPLGDGYVGDFLAV
ncbi:MAG: Dyp-type peroxidase [Chloroflexi bacterium]|nr:Dyp-type peroxidase [Chloroflexota bacterium]